MKKISTIALVICGVALCGVFGVGLLHIALHSVAAAHAAASFGAPLMHQAATTVAVKTSSLLAL